MEYFDLKIIGGGGFGTIYELPNETVLKAIHGKTNCKDAQLEFIKQTKIYDSFVRLKSLKNKNKIIQTIQKHVKIARPQLFNIKPVIVNETTYSCMLVMDKLYGLPLSFYLDAHSNMKKKFTPNFLQNLDFEVQGHLALSGQFSSYGFYPTNVNKKISSENPLRGYFITENDTLLKTLPWTIHEFKEIIGFIYGWIYYDARIIPLDIEISLGIHNNGYVINVLDFGLCIDLENINNNIYNTMTEPYIKLIEQKNYDKIYDKLLFNDWSINQFDLVEDVRYNLRILSYKIGKIRTMRAPSINILNNIIQSNDISTIYCDCVIHQIVNRYHEINDTRWYIHYNL